MADRSELIEALTVMPEFLRNAATESGAVIDYRDWQVPLGRRFRALKLWFVLRWYGVQGLRAHIRSGVALAARFADRVRSDDRFELAAAHPFALVCFRLRADNDTNAELLARVNRTGRVHLTHTRVAGRYTLRLAVGSPQTAERHVDEAWTLLTDAAKDLLNPNPGGAGRSDPGARVGGQFGDPAGQRAGGHVGDADQLQDLPLAGA
ncbi:hypothetical protein GCM10027614_24890 [Micromonospora vulcania]